MRTVSPAMIVVYTIAVALVIFAVKAILTGRPDQEHIVAWELGWEYNVYGAFWAWTNPWWWDFGLYRIYVAIFTVGISAFELWLVSRGKLPMIVFYMQQMTILFWVAVSGYQHITMTAFQALAFWNPFMMFGWIFSEVPIGNVDGWNCLLGPYRDYTYEGMTYQICGPGIFWSNEGMVLWHIAELTWALVPFVYWNVKFWTALRRKTLRQMFRGMLP